MAEIPATETTEAMAGTPEVDGMPIEGYTVIVGVNLVPAEGLIDVTMRKPTTKENLKAAVAAGTITADQYKTITGEDYVA